jgi:hypothetical protein
VAGLGFNSFFKEDFYLIMTPISFNKLSGFSCLFSEKNSFSKDLDKPKSHILTLQSWYKSTLAGLRSLCRIPFECKYYSPVRSPIAILLIYFAFKFKLDFNSFFKSESAHSSTT